jgi:hypothetical protein
MKIKAIETKYSGRYFRSRLEARWAVWFTEMGIKWEYEIVGMDLDGERYLPDFFLPEFDWHIEIKPMEISRMEAARLGRIVSKWNSGKIDDTLAVIRGQPSFDGYTLRHSGIDYGTPLMFADCRKCKGVSYVSKDDTVWGEAGIHTCGFNAERKPLPDGKRIMAAYETAIRYQFDHIKAK